jgi:uncharacterized protein with ParB-like and HNH nuclease domain
MRANETKILPFIKGQEKRFVIPVYQRNYSWNTDNCLQLFNDLESVIRENRRSHFFGSVVHLYDMGDERLIIDGQQRITTVFLFILALLHEKEEHDTDENFETRKVYNEYLIDEYKRGEIKLRLIKNDQKALAALFEKQEISSNIALNYRYLRGLIKKSSYSLSELFAAAEKLFIVEIELRFGDDDPQLIFESLNSTGLDLSEADKVRNFILMRLESSKQEAYYEKYWNKIENLTEKSAKDGVTFFLRDFLTYKERRIPIISRIYFAFKEFVQQKHPDDASKTLLLSELLTFANYYNQISEAYHENKDIEKLLKRLSRLDVKVINPFLLEIMHDFSIEKILSEEQLKEILSVLEVFLVRRILADVPTNSLNKMFVTLGRDIKNEPEYKEQYAEIFKYLLLKKQSNQRMPRDEELKRYILLKDFYNMKSYKDYIFERLENFGSKEHLMVEDASYEHIMPQNLTEVWKKELGNDYERVHKEYLHTLGNLTLLNTGRNSGMSNKSFKEKKYCEGGFAASRIYLNDSVKNKEHWNEEAIKERTALLTERLLQIWPLCATTYGRADADTENSYGLDEDKDFSGTKITAFQFDNKNEQVKTWAEFYEKFCRILYSREATQFKQFTQDSDLVRFIADNTNADRLRRGVQLANDLYIEKNLSTKRIISLLKLLCAKLGIDIGEISVTITEHTDED